LNIFLSLDWRCVMRTIVVAVLSALVVAGARADETGSKIAGDELRSLVTGAKVLHVSRAGSVRRWTNEADGTVVASSSNQKYSGAMSASATGSGSWSINSDGKFCIEIDWKREAEKWCAFIVKAADGSYYLNSVDPARKIEFAR
jgi:hypothetical protein